MKLMPLLKTCLALMSTLLLPAALAQETAGNVAWQCQFREFDATRWNLNRIEHSVVDQALRIRIPAQSQGNYGTVHTYVPACSPAFFLQVQMGNNENASAKPTVRNASSNGFSFGSLFPGWNTFSMQKTASRPFALSFSQLGAGTEAGPWVDYLQAQIAAKPTHALVADTDSQNLTLQLGDTITFRYFAATTIASPEIPLTSFLYPSFIEYSFGDPVSLNDEGRNGDEKAGDLVYSATVRISEKALTLTGEQKNTLMASVKVMGTPSYFTFPHALAINTPNQMPESIIQAGNLQTRQDRQLWFDQTKGENLALSRPLTLAPKADYRLTLDDKDNLDLTDGKLTGRIDDKIWFDRNAVGWYFEGHDVYLRLDLEKVQPLDRLVIRCLGGTSGNFKFPALFNAYVSRDGVNFHLASSLSKLQPAEAGQADFKKYYYLEEEASVYATRMYPFTLDLQADARFVILNIKGASGSIFSDELAVLKADNTNADFNAAYQTAGVAIPMEGVLATTRTGELAVITGIPAPQSFQIRDLRPADEQKDFTLLLDLPPALQIISGESTPVPTAHAIENVTYQRYAFPVTIKNKTLSIPTVFLQPTGQANDHPAFVMARCDETDHARSPLTVNIVNLPEFTPYQRLHVSLSWMSEDAGRKWPEFWQNWRRLGFNVVSSFPRFWNQKNWQDSRSFVDAAKQHGFQTIMNDSAFHEMMRGHKEGSEIFCDIPGAAPHRWLCPSYRGPFYSKEMERVKRCVVQGIPDYVFYDIECWGHVATSAAQCRRCQEAMKKSGKPISEFLMDCAVEQMHDLDAAARAGAAEAGIPVPVQGDYGRHTGTGTFFSRIYPQHINISQPSLYVAGRAHDIHRVIRNNYRELKKRVTIPWLTTGTYGEFPPFKVEQQVLEALMNGASGITYYCYTDFIDTPLDFYYHALALARLRPHENLLMDGEVLLDPKGSNPDMLYSAVKSDNEMLLLAGNYFNATEATSFTLPWNTAVDITDLKTSTTQPAQGTFTFNVGKSDFALYHIRRR